MKLRLEPSKIILRLDQKELDHLLIAKKSVTAVINFPDSQELAYKITATDKDGFLLKYQNNIIDVKVPELDLNKLRVPSKEGISYTFEQAGVLTKVYIQLGLLKE